jgi:hypothetical protein
MLIESYVKKPYEDKIVRGNLSLEWGIKKYGPWTVDTSEVNLVPPRLGLAHNVDIPEMITITLERPGDNPNYQTLMADSVVSDTCRVRLYLNPSEIGQPSVQKELATVA